MTIPPESPEALFDLIQPHLAEMTEVRIDRCDVRRCLWGGIYDFRGQRLAITMPFTLSEARSREMGLPREFPGRAWLGSTLPVGCYFGCDHRLAQELG